MPFELPKFPKQIFARWQNDTGHPADTFLRAGVCEDEMLEQHGRAKVGVYVLKAVITLDNVTVRRGAPILVSPARKKKRKNG